MLEVKRCVTPSPEQFDIVIHGMRSAFKSWDKNDSMVIDERIEDDSNVHFTPLVFKLGENDKKLLLNLTKLGTSDRKVLRQLPIILEVKAPLYWWKQADKYQIGTVTNSESTMHTLVKKPFELSDFSTDSWEDDFVLFGNPDPIILPDGTEEPCQYATTIPETFLEDVIDYLNGFRRAYLETKEKGLWNAINGLLPQSYLQTRTWSLNYEVALQIIHQRTGHPLEEWKTLIDYLLENVPYLKEIYEASCFKDNYIKKLEAEVKELRNKLKENKE